MNKFKALFFTSLIVIIALSMVPHPNSKITQENISFQSELLKLGNLAYIGEELIGEFSDKYRHIIAFLVLAFLLDMSYGFKVVYKLLFLLFYGIFIEVVQYYLPYREFDILDIVFNILSILLYYLSIRFLNLNFYKKILL